jgi:molecular chaperone HscB
MNYFSIFGIPVGLKVDPDTLRSRYLELSRKYHPDYYIHAGADEQARALEYSAQLNRAWKTFLDPDATIKYVLMEKGLLEEEEKYELPPAFLAEMLEINEALMDDEEGSGLSVSRRINEIQNEIRAAVRPIIENYHEQTTSTEELLQVKEYYYKKKYLDRIAKRFQAS